MASEQFARAVRSMVIRVDALGDTPLPHWPPDMAASRIERAAQELIQIAHGYTASSASTTAKAERERLARAAQLIEAALDELVA